MPSFTYNSGMKSVWMALGLMAVTTLARADVEVLWGITGVGGAPGILYAINPANGAVVGEKPTGLTGLSGVVVHPLTKVIYATDSNGGAGTRNLYTINPDTGVTTTIGEIGFPVADTAFRSDGTLYAWRPQTNRIYTINLTSAVATQLAGNPSTAGASGITFGTDGTFYMVRTNSLVTLNTAFGNVVTGPFVLSGAVTEVDNLFATNAAGTLYVGLRSGKGAPTTLYTITGAGVTTAAVTIPNLALSGMGFGSATAPKGFAAKKRTIRVKTPTVTLKGRVTAPLLVTIATKGKKAAVTARGDWTLKKLKVRPGKNRITLTCVDSMGQRAAPVRVTVVRS